MLILLPPSETKRPGGTGRPLDLDALVLPGLKPQRESVVSALVALSDENSPVVSVHQLVNDRLEELARIAFNEPVPLLWLNDRILLAQERGSETISELEFSGTQLICRHKINACKSWRLVRSSQRARYC